MKIAVCGSIAFFDEIVFLRKELMDLGHQVEMPRNTILNPEGMPLSSKEFNQFQKAVTANNHWVWMRVQELMKEHFEKISWADAILVANYTKSSIDHYIGGNTLMEMGVALYLGKKIFLLNPVPQVAYKEEILAMQPIILNNQLSLIP